MNFKHGMTRTKLYYIWGGMRGRCFNPKNHKYPEYGGRGITVCARWDNSFENFVEDMGECPPGFALERKDNNGNYHPNNCVWATQKDQQRNRRNNRMIEIGGIIKTIAEWCEITGVKPSTARQRLYVYHWSDESAVIIL